MAKDPKASLQVVASKNVLQILIALLFVAMGLIGFSSGRGLGSQISRELSNMFGGDNELLLYVISTLQLISGLFLGARQFSKLIPDKIAKLAYLAILIFWVALIVILDFLTIDFGRISGAEWFTWIEQVVLHLIVLSGIVQIQI
ncbi:MAG: hypothetical protein GX626_03735 [Spirochaetales bacterium]|jgi:hypothetical protein|nr:hypothetical protein [Spirochaetales bacterium]